jgi:FGGY-family pentulose kinase
MADNVVMAVDVGTGSARAGLFDIGGRMLARAARPIAMHQPRQDHAEQDSADIWQAVCGAAQEARSQAGLPPEAVAGISFDATCSLVALDRDDRPASVSTTGADRWNVVVWLDHRALAEAEECSATGHPVLNFVGGRMSPEMEIPKLMWLKRHLSAQWQRYGRLLDLADWLTFRASGSNARSVCTVTCKWTYLAHERPGWQADFLSLVGLDDLLRRAALPPAASAIATPLGPLTPAAAAELGLTPDCQVGCGLIDAHAGALGALGGTLAGAAQPSEAAAAGGLDRHIALIAGTSTCHMALSLEPRAVPGVWGPYYGAVAPGLWLNEGGQSATGALLDHILAWHAEGRALGPDGHARILHRISKLRAEAGPAFAAGLHVLPDFHGNRSPLADPHATGVISGLTLDSSLDSLARLYHRTAVGVALGTRHILDALNARGYAIDHLHVTGGHTKNPLLMELYADTTGCTVAEAAEEDAVLLGTAMAAATAAALYPDLPAAAAAMARAGPVTEPNPATRAAYDRDYRIFLAMHDQRRALERIV